MKTKILITISFCISLLGCAERKGSDVTKGGIKYIDVAFEKPVPYTLDSIKVNANLFGVKKLLVTDKYLVTMCSRTDTIFRIFTLNNLRNVCNYGNLGKGPQEFNTPIYSGFRSDGSNFIVTDLSSVKVISLPENPNSKFYPVIVQTYTLPSILVPFNNTMVINDTLIMGACNARSPQELAWFNPKTGLVGSLYDFPELIDNVPEDARWHLYSTVAEMSPDKSRIVLAYTLFPCLKIIDLESNNSSIIRVETKYKQNPNPIFDRNSVSLFDMTTFYQRVEVSQHYIAAFLEMQKFNGVVNNEFQVQSLASPEIDIFSVEGKPLARILVESWMKNFTIDEKYHRILLYNDLHDEYLYTINLDSILPNKIR